MGYQPADEKHHKLMCSLIMTSCDLCSGCKEWTWAKQIANLIYTEFFRQGDLEKALGHTPNEMMDRDKAFIPEQQLGFLDGISGPAYRYHGTTCLSDKIQLNILGYWHSYFLELLEHMKNSKETEKSGQN